MKDTCLGSDVWVVVPAYNEGRRIGAVLERLSTLSVSIVVVDDASRDDTVSRVTCFPVWLLRHPINCGQGAALQTGIEFALRQGASVIVTFDADGQHDASEIARLIGPVVAREADVSLGSRFLGTARDIPMLRWLTLKLAIVFTRLTSGLALTDVHNGFRAFSRQAASTIRIRQPRMAHASEILEEIARHGLRYQEVPVTVTYRAETLEKGQTAWGALRITGHLLAGRIWK
jgi:glycosyltransferase involved in cell wall biosynthesis